MMKSTLSSRTLLVAIVASSLPWAGALPGWANKWSRLGAAQAADFSAAELIQIGESYLKRGDTRAALSPLTIACDKDPTSAEALRLLGSAQSAEGLSAEAIHSLEAAAKLDPTDYKGLLLLGMAYDVSGQAKKAVQSYQRACELDPKGKEAQHELGMSLLMLGKQSEALAALKRAYTLANDDASIVADYAYALNGSAQSKQALKLLRLAIAAHPKDAELRFVLGESLVAQQKLSEAIEAFRVCLRLDGGHFLASYHLGLALKKRHHKEDLAAAQAALQKASELKASDPRPRLALVTLYAQEGQLERAAKEGEALRRDHPDYPPAITLLRKIYLAQGDEAAAAKLSPK